MRQTAALPLAASNQSEESPFFVQTHIGTETQLSSCALREEEAADAYSSQSMFLRFARDVSEKNSTEERSKKRLVRETICDYPG